MIPDNQTRILGVMGETLAHSKSPLMHNSAARELGLNYVYLAFEIKPGNLAQAVAALRVLNIRGVNVTIPYKEAVLPFLDELSDTAAACGAVNLIINHQGCLKGYNTDGWGFVRSLQEEGIKIRGRALFIGAGGAAKSIAYALACSGIKEMVFLDLSAGKARETATAIETQCDCSSRAEAINDEKAAYYGEQADFIINTSPVGMYPQEQETPMKEEFVNRVKPGTVLCDIIYNPLETRFLRYGRARGLKTVNGLGMFVFQGALSFEHFTGQSPPVEYMKAVVYNSLVQK